MKRSFRTTALMLLLGPVGGGVAVWTALGAVTLVVRSFAPDDGPIDSGPQLPDSVLLLWVPVLFILNVVVTVPLAWFARLRSRRPKTLCFGLILVIACALAAWLARAPPAVGNRLESFAFFFLSFASAMAGMVAINLYLATRDSARAG